MKKFFSIDCVNIYFFQSIDNYLFSIFFQWIKKCGITPHRLYHDSLTLNSFLTTIYCQIISLQGHSIDNAGNAVRYQIQNSFGLKMLTLVVFTDVSKTFDTTSCDMFLYELYLWNNK